ncbi:MAG: tyrosine-type recombinase/integrase [Pseudomonadota bacterium]|nr:tyrosine-type recombinase/integrase [Pseudomonadota bacterium]
MDTSNLIDLKPSRTENKLLTQDIVSKALGRQKEYFIRDPELKGFWLRVQPSGVKTYGIHARLNRKGNVVKRAIGSASRYTPKEAREVAKDWLRKFDDGIDPKHADRGLLTPVQLLEEYIKAKNLTEKTISGYRYNFNHYLKGLAKRSIQDIATEDIVSWYTAGTDHATGTERTFVTLKSVLDFAYALNYIDENPANKAAKLIHRKTNPSKQQHLSNIYAQLPKFMEAFIKTDISQVMRDWLVLSLTTGLRRKESMEVKWDQVNLEKKMITFSTNKSNRFLLVPMIGLTYDMLQARALDPTKDDLYVFTSKPNTPIKDARKALSKICKGAGIPPFSHHDLRRLFASVCHELNLSEEEIGKLLNHSSKSVTDIYINRSLENARKKYQMVADYLDRQVVSSNSTAADSYIETATNLMRAVFYKKVDPIFDPPVSEHERQSERHYENEYWEG